MAREHVGYLIGLQGGEPMNGNDDRRLGKWADDGYLLKEYPDHAITIEYKGKEIAAFFRPFITDQELQDACERHHVRLTIAAGVPQ